MMESPGKRVELVNLSKTFITSTRGVVKAVQNVDLLIEPGEFVTLLGPSGCGKTTLLRMVAGFEMPTDGEIRINNENVSALTPDKRDLGMVFQNYALFPHLNVFNNIAYGLKIQKLGKSVIEQRVLEGLRTVQMDDFAERVPAQMSGGQQQRVALVRALVLHPGVLLFDEPLSNLDAKLRVQMRAEISGLHNRLQATMIYVTHDQVEALTMADKIVVMKSGIIQQIGKPLELYNEPVNKFVAGFIGSPPMNFMEVKVEAEGANIFVNEGSFRLKVNEQIAKKLKSYVGKSVTFGIRPEDVQYAEDAIADSTITGVVTVVEPLGSETHVYVSTSKAQVIGKIAPEFTVKPNTKISLIPDLEKAKFFDLESELAIV